MKQKLKFLCISALFLSACNAQKEPADAPEPTADIESQETPTATEQPVETPEIIDVWDVDPVYEYDDIDTSFATHWHFGEDSYLNYALIYPIRDFYNSSGSAAFTGSFEKGGVFVYKYSRFGVMDSNGNVTHEPQYDEFNDWTSMLINQSAVMACEVNYDYSIGYCTDAWGVGGAYRHYGSLTKDALIVDGFNNKLVSVYDLHADAVEAGVIADDECFIYDAQVWSDESPNLLEGYVAIWQDSYSQLTQGFSKNLVTFSDDTILLASQNSSGARTDFEFIDMNGRILASGYEDAYGFFEGYAPVKQNGKWGYIDKDGRCITGFIFDKATPVCDGKAWVIYQGRTGKMNLISMIENNIPFDDSVLNIDDYPAVDPTDWIEIKVNSINVRNQPSTSGDKIASVKYGEIIPYISKQENEGYAWYQLNTDRWIADQNGEWIAER